MIKLASQHYEPNKRGWFKLKKDYITGLADTLDLVPIGAYYGKGKRTNDYGSFLLACYNDETKMLEPLCKCGSGFSEELLTEL